jgi:probable rRNA maturation factor
MNRSIDPSSINPCQAGVVEVRGDADQCGDSADDPSGEPPAKPDSAPVDAPSCRIELTLSAAETNPPLAGWLEGQLATIMALERGGGGCVSVAIVDAEQMARLHRQYKHHDGPTDVLSFDLSVADAGAIDAELVLCRDVAVKQSAARGHAARLELLLYAVHGLLHVLGYNDDTAAHAEAMHRHEDELLTAIGLTAAYHRAEVAES